MNPEILEMAGGDSYRANALQRLLKALAEGPNPLLREVASGVLDGEVSLRSAANNDIYSEAFADEFDGFWQRYQTQTSDERDVLLAEGHRFIEKSADPPEFPVHY